MANAMVEMGCAIRRSQSSWATPWSFSGAGFEGALRKAQARGELGPGKSPRQLSRALTTALIGMAVTGRLDRGRAELHGIYTGTYSMLD